MKCLIQYIIHSKDKYALILLLKYVNMIIIILWQEGYEIKPTVLSVIAKCPIFFAYNFHKKLLLCRVFLILQW